MFRFLLDYFLFSSYLVLENTLTTSLTYLYVDRVGAEQKNVPRNLACWKSVPDHHPESNSKHTRLNDDERSEDQKKCRCEFPCSAIVDMLELRCACW